MLPTNTFLFLLLILPLSIAADDSSFLQPQDGISPFTSSYADDALLQPITDLGLNPEVLLAGIENNEVANCQGPPPGRRSRRSRLLRKRQTDFCSWQPFKSGAQTTTPPQTSPDSDKLGATGHDGAGTPLVPTTKKSPTDVKKPEEEGKSPIPIPLSGIGNPEICGPSKETIPVCHWSPRRESSRWSSPTLVLIPVRLCRFCFLPVLPILNHRCF